MILFLEGDILSGLNENSKLRTNSIFDQECHSFSQNLIFPSSHFANVTFLNILLKCGNMKVRDNYDLKIYFMQFIMTKAFSLFAQRSTSRFIIERFFLAIVIKSCCVCVCVRVCVCVCFVRA